MTLKGLNMILENMDRFENKNNPKKHEMTKW